MANRQFNYIQVMDADLETLPAAVAEAFGMEVLVDPDDENKVLCKNGDTKNGYLVVTDSGMRGHGRIRFQPRSNGQALSNEWLDCEESVVYLLSDDGKTVAFGNSTSNLLCGATEAKSSKDGINYAVYFATVLSGIHGLWANNDASNVGTYALAIINNVAMISMAPLVTSSETQIVCDTLFAQVVGDKSVIQTTFYSIDGYDYASLKTNDTNYARLMVKLGES